MRLSDRQRNTLAHAVRRRFGPEARLWLFGSRIDDSRRGGDFDLLVRCDAGDAAWLYDAKLALLADLHATPEFDGERIAYPPGAVLAPAGSISTRHTARRHGPRSGIGAVTHPGRMKLNAALAECTLHAEVLSAATAVLPAAFTAETAQAVEPELRRWLDQSAYRFMKLQDSLGEKVLPGLLAATIDPLPPEATFAEKLQRLERLGAVPSVEQWRWLREVRNSLAHEYPENPALQAAALSRLVQGVPDLLAVWAAALRFAQTRLP